MQKTNASNLETWRCQNLWDLIRFSLNKQYKFSRVVFNPYLSIGKEPKFTNGNKVFAMPWLVIYYKGKRVDSTVVIAETFMGVGFPKYLKKITKP